jgi:hypothetical protein
LKPINEMVSGRLARFSSHYGKINGRIERMSRNSLESGAGLSALVLLATVLAAGNASAGPAPEVAKRCLHFSYIAYPFKRPGAVPMSGDRQAYFKDCMAKNGAVPMPTPPPKEQ